VPVGVQVAPIAVRHGGGVVQRVVPPPQVPFWQRSPVVQGLPSSQAAPLARQAPLAVQQPPLGHGLLAAQGTQVLVSAQIGVVPPQVPQLRLSPQPFGMVPHTAPAAAQVVGVQPGTHCPP
jgi:hypothetical protein